MSVGAGVGVGLAGYGVDVGEIVLVGGRVTVVFVGALVSLLVGTVVPAETELIWQAVIEQMRQSPISMEIHVFIRDP
jgi:hypothetical protein